MPLISVIVPTYNAEQHVMHCINQLLRQKTTFHYDIIIVDDASTDNTPELLRKISANTKVQTIFEHERKGTCACRNIGSLVGQGEIFTYTEPDCIPALNWLQKIASPIVNNKAEAVQGIVKSTGSGIWVELEKARISLYRGVSTKNFAICKQTFNKLGGFDEKFFGSDDVSAGDVEFYQRMIDAGVQLHHQRDAIVYHYWPNNPFEFLGKSKTYSLGRVQFLLEHNPKSIRWMRKRNLIRYLSGRVLAGTLESFTKTRKRINLPQSLKFVFFLYYFTFYMRTSLFLALYAKNPIVMRKDLENLALRK